MVEWVLESQDLRTQYFATKIPSPFTPLFQLSTVNLTPSILKIWLSSDMLTTAY